MSFKSSKTTRRPLPTATTSRTLFGSAQLTWILPITPWVSQGNEADVFAVAPQHRRADGAGPQRFLVKQIIENGDVVRRQIPNRIDVPANGSEVGASSVQIINAAEFRRLHVLLHLADAGVV